MKKRGNLWSSASQFLRPSFQHHQKSQSRPWGHSFTAARGNQMQFTKPAVTLKPGLPVLKSLGCLVISRLGYTSMPFCPGFCAEGPCWDSSNKAIRPGLLFKLPDLQNKRKGSTSPSGRNIVHLMRFLFFFPFFLMQNDI